MTEQQLAGLSDEQLVALFQRKGRRDERPFRELMRRYQAFVWRTCYGITRNAQDAEDLTQETFFKAYRNLGSFEGRSSFKTWIYRIAVNTSKNELRRRSRRPQVSESDTDTLSEVLTSNVTLEEEWQGKRQIDLLEEALGRLRPAEAEIIRLKDLEQRPYAEIADELGISLSAAKMRAQRARIALHVEYQQLEESQFDAG